MAKIMNVSESGEVSIDLKITIPQGSPEGFHEDKVDPKILVRDYAPVLAEMMEVYVNSFLYEAAIHSLKGEVFINNRCFLVKNEDRFRSIPISEIESIRETIEELRAGRLSYKEAIHISRMLMLNNAERPVVNSVYTWTDLVDAIQRLICYR